jgi:DNA repair exonuclease SbcCD nuclease subunit
MRFIVTADWHLRNDRPRCRIDEDWLGFQESIVEWIVSKANEYECDIKIVGDIFDTPNVPSNIVSMFLRQVSKCKERIQFIAGNHDLPWHSIDNLDNSSIGIIYNMSLHHARIYHGMTCGIWSDFNGVEKGLPKTGLAFVHKLVFENSKSIPPNVSAITASDLLDFYPSSNWIFVGDNHHGFHYQKKNRHVINCGCITRQTSDFIDYEPRIWFVDTDLGQVIEEMIPDNLPMVDDSYIKSENEREGRIEAFVEGIKKNGKVTLDFIENIEKGLLKNKKLSKETVQCIRELCEEEK